MQKTGLLIVNLGSTRSPQISDIRAFLKEFLMDPYVIDIPSPLRYALVNWFILPRRPQKLTDEYKAIWTKQGSPIITYTQSFREKLSQILNAKNEDFEVEIAMRYGSPSIQQALEHFKSINIKKILVFMGYPQDADSSLKTAREKIIEVSHKVDSNTLLRFVPAYYNQEFFIDSLAKKYRKTTEGQKIDQVIMSFHGIPNRHIKKQSKNLQCLTPGCCDRFSSLNDDCYKAQCFETARALAKKLNLNSSDYIVSFQSRLTKNWITPFTDDVVQELGKQHKNIAIICPAFVTDCLETLFEVQITEQQRFKLAGGKNYLYIPCLNDEDFWVEAVANNLLKTW